MQFLILETRKSRLRQVSYLSQGHTTPKGRSAVPKPRCMCPVPSALHGELHSGCDQWGLSMTQGWVAAEYRGLVRPGGGWEMVKSGAPQGFSPQNAACLMGDFAPEDARISVFNRCLPFPQPRLPTVIHFEIQKGTRQGDAAQGMFHRQRQHHPTLDQSNQSVWGAGPGICILIPAEGVLLTSV